MRGDLRTILADKLDPKELKTVYKSYDVVGDIAIIRVSEALRERSKIIAEAIMQTQKRVKAVWRQASPVSSDFRLRDLEFVLGERKTETLHKEHECIFKLDLEKCYFSPRLSYERMRIARQVKPGEVVLNMFAGVGSYSIAIAKHSRVKKVFSIDINPVAIQYMRENIRLNKVEKRVIPIREDAKKAVEEELQNIADRVLMPLPEKAYEYFGTALQSLKPTGGRIHYYDFEHSKRYENPVKKTELRLSKKLQTLGVYFQVVFGRIVRTTGPNWYQVVLDIQVEKSS